MELVDDFINLYYDWDPEYNVQTSVAEKDWFVEMAIPFASLKTGVARPSVYKERKEEERSAFSLLKAPVVTSGTTWNISLCRRRIEPNELSSWSSVCDKFYAPYQFGHLIFSEGFNKKKISALKNQVDKHHAKVVSEKNRTEQNRLQPILKEINKQIDCEWTAIQRRNLFMGYESRDGKIQIPNYAHLDGQGRIVLPEKIPHLSEKILNKIIVKETPRFVFDKKSLSELREKIKQYPNINKQWLKLKKEADALLNKPMPDFIPCEMQHDRNCVPREKAKSAGAAYGLLGTIRSKCALTYAISQDKKYAQKAWKAQSYLIDHFYKYQVFRMACNWYSIWDPSYEVYTSTYIFDMIADAGVLTKEDKIKLVEFIRRIGYRVNYCVKYSGMIGNHQFMWTNNMGCMALYFPEFPEYNRWAQDVETRMPMLYNDILTDGGQIERSPDHHIFGLSFLCRYVTAKKRLSGEDIFNKKYDGKSLEMALDWMVKITK